MSKILIFGGTTEGRLLAEFCHENKVDVWISVATGYGKTVLRESEYLHIHEKPMDAEEMAGFIREEGITLVFDATHPYAVLVSRNIREACKETAIKYLRVTREQADLTLTGSREERIIWVDSVKEAAGFLVNTSGNVLVTTGSKELSEFTALEHWEERIYARVLPSFHVISACEEMGLKGKHLIGMQGPFSEEMNRAMIKQYDIRYLVTKEAGTAGGFLEKMKAAAECGIPVIVVGRPAKETGVSVKEARDILFEWGKKCPVNAVKKRKVWLIGAGMRGPDQMTVKAFQTLALCDVFFGSERMLLDMEALLPEIKKIPYYMSQDILKWLAEHKEHMRIGILYSGDTGFYSGAKKMAEALTEEVCCQEFEVEILPGISSVSYFCSRLKIAWEDVCLVSLHGREADFIKALKENKRVFALLDGNHTVKYICNILKEQGFYDAKLWVGERLSYPDERITAGTPKTLCTQEFNVLSALLIER